MNIEHIHDALNLLDDDMIEAVEQLRDGKIQRIKSHKKRTWLGWVAMAACLCLVVGSYYLTNGFGLMSYKGASNDSLKQESGNWTPNHGSSESVGSVPESEKDEDGTDVTDDMSGENQNELVETPSVLIEIVSWDKNGFTGTVTGIVDTKIYPVGTNVTVKFSDNTHVDVSTDDGEICKDYIPNSTDFPAGSIVRVQFNKSEVVEHSSKDQGNIETQVEMILYAEVIELSDSE